MGCLWPFNQIGLSEDRPQLTQIYLKCNQIIWSERAGSSSLSAWAAQRAHFGVPHPERKQQTRVWSSLPLVGGKVITGITQARSWKSKHCRSFLSKGRKLSGRQLEWNPWTPPPCTGWKPSKPFHWTREAVLKWPWSGTKGELQTALEALVFKWFNIKSFKRNCTPCAPCALGWRGCHTGPDTPAFTWLHEKKNQKIGVPWSH